MSRQTDSVRPRSPTRRRSQGITVNVWPRNLWYARVTLADVDEILDRSVVGEEEIERLRMPDIPWE